MGRGSFLDFLKNDRTIRNEREREREREREKSEKRDKRSECECMLSTH
jgi:hypothetical protein